MSKLKNRQKMGVHLNEESEDDVVRKHVSIEVEQWGDKKVFKDPIRIMPKAHNVTYDSAGAPNYTASMAEINQLHPIIKRSVDKFGYTR